jgi:hypothetical protein
LRALSLSTSSKSALNLLSRSWIRNRICANRPVKLRLRSCWLTQAPYFCAWNEPEPARAQDKPTANGGDEVL